MSVESKRVYAPSTERDDALLVAGRTGVVRVAVADEHVGEFDLERRGPAHDFARVRRDDEFPSPHEDGVRGAGIPGEPRVVVATADGLLDRSRGYAVIDPEPVTRVGATAAGPLLGRPDGTIAVHHGDGPRTVGQTSELRTITRRFVGAESGLFRLDDDGARLTRLLDVAVNDIAVSPDAVLVATTDALLIGSPGAWTTAIDGVATRVAAAGERAVAVVDGTLSARRGGRWRSVATPGGDGDAIRGLTAGTVTIAVDASGTLHTARIEDDHPRWRPWPIGIAEPRALLRLPAAEEPAG